MNENDRYEPIDANDTASSQLPEDHEPLSEEQSDEQTAQSTDETDDKLVELANLPEEIVDKLRDHISTENIEFLIDLIDGGAEYDDIIGDVYGMILEEGGDPDKILAELGLTE